MGEKRWPKWSYFTTLNNWILSVQLVGMWFQAGFFNYRTCKVWIQLFANGMDKNHQWSMAIGMVSLGKVWTFKCWRGQRLAKKGLVGFNDVRYRWICCIYACFIIIYLYIYIHDDIWAAICHQQVNTSNCCWCLFPHRAVTLMDAFLPSNIADWSWLPVSCLEMVQADVEFSLVEKEISFPESEVSSIASLSSLSSLACEKGRHVGFFPKSSRQNLCHILTPRPNDW